jgi:hypothetical protein
MPTRGDLRPPNWRAQPALERRARIFWRDWSASTVTSTHNRWASTFSMPKWKRPSCFRSSREPSWRDSDDVRYSQHVSRVAVCDLPRSSRRLSAAGIGDCATEMLLGAFVSSFFQAHTRPATILIKELHPCGFNGIAQPDRSCLAPSQRAV